MKTMWGLGLLEISIILRGEIQLGMITTCRVCAGFSNSKDRRTQLYSNLWWNQEIQFTYQCYCFENKLFILWWLGTCGFNNVIHSRVFFFFSWKGWRWFGVLVLCFYIYGNGWVVRLSSSWAEERKERQQGSRFGVFDFVFYYYLIRLLLH